MLVRNKLYYEVFVVVFLTRDEKRERFPTCSCRAGDGGAYLYSVPHHSTLFPYVCIIHVWQLQNLLINANYLYIIEYYVYSRRSSCSTVAWHNPHYCTNILSNNISTAFLRVLHMRVYNLRAQFYLHMNHGSYFTSTWNMVHVYV